MNDTVKTNLNVSTDPVEHVVHTPGPWNVSTSGKSYDGHVVEGSLCVFGQHQNDPRVVGNSGVVCWVSPPDFTTKEDRANAKLISKSPDMKRLLERTIQMMNDRRLYGPLRKDIESLLEVV